MECPQIPEIGYAETSLGLHKKAGSRRVPINGVIELTSRCNLKCVHCYIRDTEHRKELGYDEICNILDQIADEGCLWLCFTGGEPLTRPDFKDIYSYAKHKGFLITLFSNATLITPSMADFLAAEPPFIIDISLYGMTAETYEKVTGIPGSFDRFMKGIELALDRHLPLKFKSMVINLNAHEFHDMRRWAKSLGVNHRYDMNINCKIDGNTEPVQYRLTPEEVISLQAEDKELAESVSKELTRLCKVRSENPYLYLCSAGVHNFYITSDGKLNICVFSSMPNHDLRTRSFHEGFFDIFPKVRDIKRTRFSECQVCPALNVCGYCPASAILERDDPESIDETECRTAKLMLDTFVNRNNPG